MNGYMSKKTYRIFGTTIPIEIAEYPMNFKQDTVGCELNYCDGIDLSVMPCVKVTVA